MPILDVGQTVGFMDDLGGSHDAVVPVDDIAVPEPTILITSKYSGTWGDTWTARDVDTGTEYCISSASFKNAVECVEFILGIRTLSAENPGPFRERTYFEKNNPDASKDWYIAQGDKLAAKAKTDKAAAEERAKPIAEATARSQAGIRRLSGN